MMARLRFVILHHTGVREPHYDLMIESRPGGPLHAWRCNQNPLTVYLTIASRIVNHRPIYLDYEGEVNGDRGHVARVGSGTCIFHRIRPRTWTFRLDAPAVYPAYFMAPARGRQLWLIEGETGTSGG